MNLYFVTFLLNLTKKMSISQRKPVDTRKFNLEDSIFAEINLFGDSVEIKQNNFIFAADVEKINSLMPDVPLKMSVSDFFYFVVNLLQNDYYLFQNINKEFKIILEYIITFNDNKFKKTVELIFDFIPPEKDQLTIIEEKLENLQKKITPTMEKISLIVDKEIEEFYKIFPIERISSIASNNKYLAKDYYLGTSTFREAGKEMTTLDILNYSSSKMFTFKWGYLNSITKSIIADEVDNHLKNN